MDHSGGGGGVGPSSFCSRAEGQSFAETDAVFTEADTAAPPIVDHRFIVTTPGSATERCFQLHLQIMCRRGNRNFSVSSYGV